MSDQLNYSGDPISRDAVRCRPADAPVVVEPTWQPAYVGPRPGYERGQAGDRGSAQIVRFRRSAGRPARTLRRAFVDLAENLLLAAATWLDERGRRTR